MNTLLKKVMLAVTLGVGLSLANVGSTTAPGDGEDPPPPPPGDCSPGFYKNHIEFWWGIYCSVESGECATLLSQLVCKGADATCGRSTAAAFLNAQSGCTED